MHLLLNPGHSDSSDSDPKMIDDFEGREESEEIWKRGRTERVRQTEETSERQKPHV